MSRLPEYARIHENERYELAKRDLALIDTLRGMEAELKSIRQLLTRALPPPAPASDDGPQA